MTNSLTRQASLMPTIFDDLVNPWSDLLGNFRMGASNFSVPAVNITTQNGDYLISMAVPGMKKDDFKIDFDDNLLTISCTNEESNEERNVRYTRKEYNYATFSRTFTIPNEVNTDKIDAHYENGILSIKLPARAEFKKQSEAKQIPIK
jgi:HSP20 family protein